MKGTWKLRRGTPRLTSILFAGPKRTVKLGRFDFGIDHDGSWFGWYTYNFVPPRLLRSVERALGIDRDDFQNGMEVMLDDVPTREGVEPKLNAIAARLNELEVAP